MGQIIVVQVGGAGVRIGQALAVALAAEHGIDASGQASAVEEHRALGREVFFAQDVSGRYHFRGVVADVDPAAAKLVESGLQRATGVVVGRKAGNGSYAAAWFEQELADRAVAAVRYLADGCSELDGFLIVHSLGGGTGSGLTTTILERLAADYPGVTKVAASVFPSPLVSDAVLEPYNTVLGLAALLSHVNLVVCLDNEAFYDATLHATGLPGPGPTALNPLLVAALAAFTAPLRVPAASTVSPAMAALAAQWAEARDWMRGDWAAYKRRMRLDPALPEPSLVAHRPQRTLADLVSHLCVAGDQALPLVGLAWGRLAPESGVRYSSGGDDLGKLLDLARSDDHHSMRIDRFAPKERVAVWLRGLVSADPGRFELRRLADESGLAALTILEMLQGTPPAVQSDVLMAVSSSSAAELLRRELQQFDLMWRRQAFLHLYAEQGMDTDEFVGAREAVSRLADAYAALAPAPAEEELVDSEG